MTTFAANETDIPGREAPLVVLDDVHLKLDSLAGPVNVLRGVSLTIARGERVGVVGPSGSTAAFRIAAARVAA
jgi:putative ABC transport system ATP-binding protein